MNTNEPREVTVAIEQLRAEIEQLPINKGGKRRGISDGLKRRAAHLQSNSGMTLDNFARAIHISGSALNSWRKQFQSGSGTHFKKQLSQPGFKEISIVPEPEPKLNSPVRGITIEGPNGIKITGLSCDEVARLWRSLC